MPNTAYLSLGSNIEPEDNMIAAVAMLAELTKLAALSPVWETKPVGLTNQPNFLNAAAVVETNRNAPQLVQEVAHYIEDCLGRVRGANKNAPRTIDIDLILFNRQVFDLDQRHIPSPDLLERPFVAIPLAHIAPGYRHPETGQTLREIADRFTIAPDDMQLRRRITQKIAALAASMKRVR